MSCLGLSLSEMSKSKFSKFKSFSESIQVSFRINCPVLETIWLFVSFRIGSGRVEGKDKDKDKKSEDSVVECGFSKLG